MPQQPGIQEAAQAYRRKYGLASEQQPSIEEAAAAYRSKYLQPPVMEPAAPAPRPEPAPTIRQAPSPALEPPPLTVARRAPDLSALDVLARPAPTDVRGTMAGIRGLVGRPEPAIEPPDLASRVLRRAAATGELPGPEGLRAPLPPERRGLSAPRVLLEQALASALPIKKVREREEARVLERAAPEVVAAHPEAIAAASALGRAGGEYATWQLLAPVAKAGAAAIGRVAEAGEKVLPRAAQRITEMATRTPGAFRTAAAVRGVARAAGALPAFVGAREWLETGDPKTAFLAVEEIAQHPVTAVILGLAGASAAAAKPQISFSRALADVETTIRARPEDARAVLGVGPEATKAEIDAAFRQRAAPFHPDRKPPAGAEEVFKIMSAAHSKLVTDLRGKAPAEPPVTEPAPRAEAPTQPRPTVRPEPAAEPAARPRPAPVEPPPLTVPRLETPEQFASGMAERLRRAETANELTEIEQRVRGSTLLSETQREDLLGATQAKRAFLSERITLPPPELPARPAERTRPVEQVAPEPAEITPEPTAPAIAPMAKGEENFDRLTRAWEQASEEATQLKRALDEGDESVRRFYEEVNERVRRLRTTLNNVGWRSQNDATFRAEQIPSPEEVLGEPVAPKAVRPAEEPAGIVRLYHGSPAGFEEFDPGRRSETGLGGKGFFFTESPELASAYAGVEPTTAPQVRFIDVPRSQLLDISKPPPDLPKSGDIDAAIQQRGYRGTYDPKTGQYVIYDPADLQPPAEPEIRTVVHPLRGRIEVRGEGPTTYWRDPDDTTSPFAGRWLLASPEFRADIEGASTAKAGAEMPTAPAEPAAPIEAAPAEPLTPPAPATVTVPSEQAENVIGRAKRLNAIARRYAAEQGIPYYEWDEKPPDLFQRYGLPQGITTELGVPIFGSSPNVYVDDEAGGAPRAVVGLRERPETAEERKAREARHAELVRAGAIVPSPTTAVTPAVPQAPAVEPEPAPAAETVPVTPVEAPSEPVTEAAPPVPPEARKTEPPVTREPNQPRGFFDMSAAAKGTAGLLRRYFTSAGDLPKPVFERKIQRDGWINSQMRQVAYTLRKFRTAAKQAEDVDLASVDRVLKGEVAPEAIPESLRPIVQKMRSEIDALSHRLIENGAIEGPLVATVTENFGVYATRSYQVHDDPSWASKVPEDVRNKAKALLRSEFPDKSEAEIAGLINELLYTEDAPISVLVKGKLGSKNLSILQRRKDIAPEIRALWGEYTDPMVNYARSVSKMAQLVANHELLTDVREAGLGKIFFEEPTMQGDVSYHVQIAAEGSQVMKPLNGLYTSPELAAAFKEALDPNVPPWYLRTWMQANGVAKFAKTVGSVMTHVRNTLGNTGFAVANGHWRVKEAGKAIRTTLANIGALNDEGWRNYYRKLVELGVVHESPNAGELFDVIRDASKKGLDDPTASWMVRSAKRVTKGLTEVYRAEDDVWKVYAFENEKLRYQKARPDTPAGEIERTAAEIVRNTYPTYSLVPRGVKLLRRFPLLGPFVSFPAEVFRTGYNTIELAGRELSEPDLRSVGAERLVGILLASSLVPAAAFASRFLTGADDDTDGDIRTFLPPWSENSNIAYLNRSDDGKIRYVDLSYTDPHNYLRKPIIAFLRGDDWVESLRESTLEAARPFVSEEIFTQKLLDISRNQTREGRQVYNPADDPVGQFEDILAHVYDGIEPGTITSAKRVWNGVTGRQTLYGRAYDPKIEAMAAMSGIRVSELDVPQALGFGMYRTSNELDDARRILTSVLSRRGVVDAGEIAEAYAASERSRKKAFEAAHLMTQAALSLGMTEIDINRTVGDAGFSLADSRSITSGEYRPYRPSDQFLNDTAERLGTEGQAEFQRRLSELREAMPEALEMRESRPLRPARPTRPLRPLAPR